MESFNLTHDSGYPAGYGGEQAADIVAEGHTAVPQPDAGRHCRRSHFTATVASGNGARPNSDVLEVTGTAPVTFAEFAARTAPAWK